LIRPWLLVRKPDAHKGHFGHVLVVAGSRGMMGAAGLCAAGAMRSGAGLVTLAVPRSERFAAVRRGLRAMMTLPLPDTPEGTFHSKCVKDLLKFIRKRRVTAVAIGPGLRVTSHTTRLVSGLLRGTRVPGVLDADGLNALSRFRPKTRVAAPLLLTPHPGEAGRILGIDTTRVNRGREEAVRSLANDLKAIALLKGPRTLVSDGRQVYENRTGNAGLAKGGSGDVLTGVAAALAGQTAGSSDAERLLRAAIIGAHVHGLAADLAVMRSLPRISLTADDLLEFLPAAFRKIFGNKI
jgi:hydroxyethylthiazole kinase-like uncharacterized protein yjeF